MHSYEKIDLDEYRGKTYFLVGFVRPDPAPYDVYNPDEVAKEYGVTLVRNAETRMDDNAQIVRLDNAHGQTPHVDKVYLPTDTVEDEKQELEGSWPYSRMRTFLLEKWQEYADLYRYYEK